MRASTPARTTISASHSRSRSCWLVCAPCCAGASGHSWNRSIRIGDVTVDFPSHTVARAGQPMELSPREFALLEALVRNRGRVLSRDQLLERVWGYDADPQSNVVELYIHYLRRKLDPNGNDAEPLIRTIRGAGYVIPAS